MGPRVYVGTRGCLPTAGIGWGCLLSVAFYATIAALAIRKARR